MRVLVVEDDHSLGRFLQKGLTLEGHTVVLICDGQAALEEARLHPPDLMVLDLGLPSRDGTEVLQDMRKKHLGTAVLVVSGRDSLEERLRCLNLGADDFLQKPFSFSELTVRCRVLLRRHERLIDPIVQFGGVEMDRLERTVCREGHVVDLTVTEFKLLEVLMLHKGSCCTREELLKKVWKSSPEVSANIVDIYVNYLRKKLSVLGTEGKFGDPLIETVRGKGYRLHSRDPIQALPLSGLPQRHDPIPALSSLVGAA